MRQSALALSALLVAGVLAGCSGTDQTTTTTTTNGPPPSPYQLDCSIRNGNETCAAVASPNFSLAKAEIDAAVNPVDPNNVFVASKDRDPLASQKDDGTPCVWAVGQYTKDGGKTWNTTYIGKVLAERMPGEPLYGWRCITDPIVAFEPDGTLHYSLQVYDYDPAAVPTVPVGPVPLPPEMGFMYHAVSRDGGATFPDIFLMHGGDEITVFHDFMRIGVNPATGTTLTIWNQLTGVLPVGVGASIPVGVAVESGATQARPPVYFQSGDAAATSLGASGVAGHDDGTASGILHVLLGGFNSGGRAVLTSSTDDGMTWSDAREVFRFTPMGDLPSHDGYEAQYRHGTVVELAVDDTDGPRAGCLYAAWGGREDGMDRKDPADVFVRRSCDQGATWTDPMLVNRKTREDGQWMPRVSVDGRGTVHVVYLSRHHDRDHNLVDAEHAWSTDGGGNWTTERVTSISFDGNLGLHQNDFPFIGDYIGIASAGDHTWMAFPSTESGRAEILAAHSRYVGA